VTPRRRDVVPLSTRERLEGEKDALGLYLTGHPIEDYLDELGHIRGCDIAGLRPRRGSQLIAGLVVSTRVLPARRGGDNCFLEIDDRSGRIEVALFGETYETHRAKIAKGVILVVEGEVQSDELGGSLKVRAERVLTIEEVRQRFGEGLQVDLSALPEPGPIADLPTRLRACLEPHRKARTGCPVEVVYQAAGPGGVRARGRIRLGPDWQVNPSDDLLERLRSEFGAARVSLRYGIA
jgi:DNA polymerase-3 subunit alpha